MTDAAADLLRELVAEVRGLRDDLAVRRRRRLARDDHAQLAILLPIVGSHVGERVFTVHELVEHALLPGEVELREAIAAIGGSNRVGRLLKRANGHDVDGIRVQSVGAERAGILWGITRMSEPVVRR